MLTLHSQNRLVHPIIFAVHELASRKNTTSGNRRDIRNEVYAESKIAKQLITAVARNLDWDVDFSYHATVEILDLVLERSFRVPHLTNIDFAHDIFPLLQDVNALKTCRDPQMAALAEQIIYLRHKTKIVRALRQALCDWYAIAAPGN